MPVQKFRSIEDASRALWMDPGDPKLVRVIRSLWRRGALFAPVVLPRGVRRFRSIEAADADRDRLTAEAMRRVRAERTAPGRP